MSGGRIILLHGADTFPASFCGAAQIPDLPHLIVVPNTLIGQWEAEIREFFDPQGVDLIVVDAAKKTWSSAFAALRQSNQPAIRRVVLIAHSVSFSRIMPSLPNDAYVVLELHRNGESSALFPDRRFRDRQD